MFPREEVDISMLCRGAMAKEEKMERESLESFRCLEYGPAHLRSWHLEGYQPASPKACLDHAMAFLDYLVQMKPSCSQLGEPGIGWENEGGP